MGIKNLRALLQRRGTLLGLAHPDGRKTMFVDYMGLYVPIAYSCSSEPEIVSTVETRVRSLARRFELTLFVDRGAIALKAATRARRREAKCACMERKRAQNATLETLRAGLEGMDLAVAEARISRNSFFLFLGERNNLRRIAERALARVADAAEIRYCEGVDAEFRMCAAARDRAAAVGEWPVVFSVDQDALAFCSGDTLPKCFYNAVEYSLFAPEPASFYLCALTVLINGCDYFAGLRGLAITPENCRRFALHRVFTRENVFDSLACQSVSLQPTDFRVERVIEFVNLYLGLNERCYDYADVAATTVTYREFVSALARDAYARRLGCAPGKENEPPYLEALLRALIGPAENAALTPAAVARYRAYAAAVPAAPAVPQIAHALRLVGYELSARHRGRVLVDAARRDLYLKLKDDIYFSNRAILSLTGLDFAAHKLAGAVPLEECVVRDGVPDGL
ncbi:virion core protein [Saltwater crocodilepox virus]|nr:virion core protein [Saltwater crocodilepox virus]AVD69434.1 virion core protein [Saltwater crocodilepox virus]QGT46538.1 ORF099 [Saltwater crocodilepox virus]QGT46754.1 ORF099 [Saltwater crocodilepox virus]QGT46970.1 ORF099 [Saltwater crocodilepox virus]